MDDPRAAAVWPEGCTLVVLSGGTSRRLGRDKASTHVGGRTLVERIVANVPPAVPVVLVGPPVAALAGRVHVTREEPPGSGPLAAIAAGASMATTPLVGVLATDMPFALPVVAAGLKMLAEPRLDTVARAAAGAGPLATDAESRDQVRDPSPGEAPDRADALIPVDDEGRVQPLAAAFRTEPLLRALAGLAPLAGRPVRALLPHLRVMEWHAPQERLADVDTAQDLSHARRRAADEEESTMQEWIIAVRDALGLDVAVDLDSILDVARDAAHNVERPAAPVTTYLLGAAVAQGADPTATAATISEMAARWTRPSS